MQSFVSTSPLPRPCTSVSGKPTRNTVVVRSVSKELPPTPSSRSKLEAQRQEQLKDNVNALVAVAQKDTEYLSIVWKECTEALSKLVDSHKRAFDKHAKKTDP